MNERDNYETMREAAHLYIKGIRIVEVVEP
jgi:hypothetical protein